MPIKFISKHSFFNSHAAGHLKIGEHAALYLTHTMRQMSVALIGIFLPIYIYEISPNFLIFSQSHEINGVAWVLLFFCMRSFGTLVFTYILGNSLFSKIHLQRAIIISFFVLIAEMLVLLYADRNLYLIIIAGLLAGLKVTTYWIPYHGFFVKKMGDVSGHFGKKTGIRFSLVRIVTGLAPFVGGLIITVFGFNVLFIASIMLLVVASIPILNSVNEGSHIKHDPLKITRDYLLKKKYAKVTLAFFGDGAEALVYAIFWPILLFVVLDNFVKLGSLNSVSLLISSISMYFVGRLVDKYGSKLVHGVGIFINSAFYIPRIFISNALFFYGLDVADRFNSAFYSVPNMTLAYEKAAKAENASDFIIYRELAIHVSIVLFSCILMVILPIVGVWRWVFAIAAIGSILTYLLDEE